MIKKSELTKESYRAGEVAQITGLSTGTIKNYMRDGKIDFEYLPNSNHRRITKETLINFLDNNGLYFDDEKERMDIIYVRVNSKEKIKNLNQQKQILTNYMINKNPYNLKIIEDIDSGLNENREGLKEVLNLILNSKINRLIINKKEDLTRFGFEYIKTICDFNNTKIIIVEEDKNNKNSIIELKEDFVKLINENKNKFNQEIKELIKKELNE